MVVAVRFLRQSGPLNASNPEWLLFGELGDRMLWNSVVGTSELIDECGSLPELDGCDSTVGSSEAAIKTVGIEKRKSVATRAILGRVPKGRWESKIALMRSSTLVRWAIAMPPHTRCSSRRLTDDAKSKRCRAYCARSPVFEMTASSQLRSARSAIQRRRYQASG